MYKLIGTFLLLTCAAFAQTTVTATVTDANRNPYANGTASAYALVATGKVAPPPTNVTTSGAGFFTMSLPANTYTFTVCAAPTALGPTTNPTPTQVCFSSGPIAISGVSTDISTNLNALATVLGPQLSGGVATGTTGQLGVYTSNFAVGPDPNCDDSITSASTLTCIISFATPQVNLTGTGGLALTSAGGTLPTPGASTGGIGIATGAIPQINPNNAGWFAIPYITVGGTALANTANNTNFSNTTPTAPANGLNISWQFSGQNISAAVVGDGNAAHALCGNGVFGACTAGGATALSGLTAATGANTLANGNFPQTWNWAQTTNSQAGLTFGETSAATGGTLTSTLANQSNVSVSTASASTATPFNVTQGSVTGATAFPIAQFQTTWNNAGLTGQGVVIAVTDTSSTVSSTPLSVQRPPGSTAFAVDKFGDVAIANLSAYGGNSATAAITFCGGTSIGQACIANTNGTNGGAIFQGSDNNSTGASAKSGYAILRGGIISAASPNAAALEGVAQLGSGFLKGSAVAALGDVVCGTTTAFTVTDCSHTGPAVNIIGIANTTSNPIGVVSQGQALVKTDGAVTIGDTICMGTTTDGQAHDNGTAACATAGTSIGVVLATSGTITQMSGTGTASTAMSTTLPLVQLFIGK